jgi:hypothetical protein
MPTQQDLIVLKGGLDAETPYLSIQPGMVRSSRNFEPGLNGGYQRNSGFERFDGHPEPHLQTYRLVEVADPSALAVGQIVTGLVSGATGTIVAIEPPDTVVLPQIPTNDIALAKVTGAPFIDGEDLQVAAVTQTTVIGDRNEDTADLDVDSSFRNVAQDLYRADIAECPGEGGILGTFTHLQFDYCWRNNIGSTEADMYVATLAGWVKVVIRTHVLFFENGSDTLLTRAPIVGDVVTGASSAAVGTIIAVVKQLGAWGDDDAEGYFAIETVTGTFTTGEDLEISAVVAASATQDSTPVTFEPGGDYYSISHNFYAADSTYYMYFVDGVTASGFEFQPLTQTLIPIQPLPFIAGNDAPFFLKAHKLHLFFAYPEGSLQHSSPGLPLIWDGALGAAEFGLGAEISGLEIEAGEVFIAYTSRTTWGLYGNNVNDWTLSLISPETGGVKYTTQQVKVVIALDDRGLVTLPRSDTYGNFQHGTISRLVQSLVAGAKGQTTKASLVRTKNQYRLFFETGLFIIVYLPETTNLADGTDPSSVAQFMVCDLGGLVVKTISNAEDHNGTEKILFGTPDNGMVYRSEVGMNHDGDPIEAWLELPFNHSRDPRVRKRYRRAFIQLDTEGPTSMSVSSEITFGEANTKQPKDGNLFAIGAEGGLWDIDDWDVIFWDAVSSHEVRYTLTGTGININFILQSISEINTPFTVHSVMIDFEKRRRER